MCVGALKSSFKRGQIDKVLSIKTKQKHFLIVVIYVGDILFGDPNVPLYDKFSMLMRKSMR